jgi:hypothetical protein
VRLVSFQAQNTLSGFRLFADATYKSIRDKQMDEAVLEDELLNKASIR